jgi:hypothetical protein
MERNLPISARPCVMKLIGSRRPSALNSINPAMLCIMKLVQQCHMSWKWFNEVKYPEIGWFSKALCPEDEIGTAGPCNIKLLGLARSCTMNIELI